MRFCEVRSSVHLQACSHVSGLPPLLQDPENDLVFLTPN